MGGKIGKHEDNEDNEDVAMDNKHNVVHKRIKEDKMRKDVPSESESSSDESESETKQERYLTEKKHEKTQRNEDSSEEQSSSESSEEEQVVTTNKTKTETKQSRDVPDGSVASRKSDYSTKSVEDLEYLQEDIHKELAQISEKQRQRKKHKKTSSSTREKHHRERSSENRGYHSKESVGRGRDDGYREHRKDGDSRSGRVRDVGGKEKQRPYEEQRRGKEERRDREEKGTARSYSHGDYSPRRQVTLKESSGGSRRDMSDRRQESGRQDRRKQESSRQEMTTKESTGESSRKNVGSSKAAISDSLREMIHASVKDIKNDVPRDRKGLNTEIIDYESDDSVGYDLLGERNLSDESTSSSENSQDEETKSPEKPKLPPYLPAILGCRNVEEFQWLNRIEEGTYGVVYRAKDKRSGKAYLILILENFFMVHRKGSSQ